MVITLGIFDTSLDQPVYSLRVSHSHKWTGGLGKLRVILLDAPCSYGILESQIDYAAYDVFKVSQEIVECYEIQLGFDMGVLGKLLLFISVTRTPYIQPRTHNVQTYMTASERLLGSEGLLNTVDITKSREQCLQIQLA